MSNSVPYEWGLSLPLKYTDMITQKVGIFSETDDEGHTGTEFFFVPQA
jgi:hypothetical protein